MLISNEQSVIRCPFSSLPCEGSRCACFRWDSPPVFVPELDSEGKPILDDCEEIVGTEVTNHPNRKGHCGLAGATSR